MQLLGIWAVMTTTLLALLLNQIPLFECSLMLLQYTVAQDCFPLPSNFHSTNSNVHLLSKHFYLHC